MKSNISWLALITFGIAVLVALEIQQSHESRNQTSIIGTYCGTSQDAGKRWFEDTITRLEQFSQSTEARDIQADQVWRGRFEVILSKVEAAIERLDRVEKILNPVKPIPGEGRQVGSRP